MEPPLQTGLSQEQLATMWEEQNPGRTLGGLHAPVTGTGSFSVNVQGGAYGYGLYEGAPHVTTWEGTRASYGGPVEPMTVGSVPVRRLVDRVGGEAVLYGSARGGYSSVQQSHMPIRTPDIQYYAQPMHAAPPYVVETAPMMVMRAPQPVFEHRPSLSALGYVPCDVLPEKAATVHDIWSGANFCDEVAEMLQASGNNKYFSEGVTEPKMHQLVRGGLERDMTDKAGIGIALERSETSGLVSVKRIAVDGSAAADGRLRPGDLILGVDGLQTSVIGSELTNLIIGPEGTFVELFVEHTNGEQEAIQIRRGVPAPSAHIPYGSYKTYQEVPYYLSANDREQATVEVSNVIAEMRRRIMNPNAAHDKPNATHDKAYGVARRTSSDTMVPAPAPAPAPAPVTSPKVINTVPSPGVERAMKSPVLAHEEEKLDFRAAQARFAQQEAELHAAQRESVASATSEVLPNHAAQQAAEYERAEAQALAEANSVASPPPSGNVEAKTSGSSGGGNSSGGGGGKKKKKR